MPTQRTTVVIATRNRRDELVRHLARHEASVVVVDNASSDGTAEAVHAHHPRVHLVRLRRNVGAHARTIGARVATTPYLAFADDDSWWEPGSLAAAESVFDAYPGLGLIAGALTVGSHAAPDPFNAVLAGSTLPPLGPSPGPALLGFVACAAIVRRRAFLAVGGFDDIVRFPGEEERLALDLDDPGWMLAHVPDVVARHVPSSLRESPESRRRGLERSRLLTAVLRRPWRDVARLAATAAGTPCGRHALREALPRVPGALRRRRRVGARTLERIAALETSRRAAS